MMSTQSDVYRKPAVGMWRHLVDNVITILSYCTLSLYTDSWSYQTSGFSFLHLN